MSIWSSCDYRRFYPTTRFPQCHLQFHMSGFNQRPSCISTNIPENEYSWYVTPSRAVIRNCKQLEDSSRRISSLLSLGPKSTSGYFLTVPSPSLARQIYYHFCNNLQLDVFQIVRRLHRFIFFGQWAISIHFDLVPCIETILYSWLGRCIQNKSATKCNWYYSYVILPPTYG